MGTIYKIINDLNSKIYIGKTVETLASRWSKHIYASKKSDTHLYRAMNKYGLEHFSIIPLEENVSDEILNEREIYWIKELDTIKNGYNTTIGGDGRKWIQREEVATKYLEGQSVRQISEELGVWYSSVVDVLKELGLYDKEEIIDRGFLHSGIKQSESRVLQYTEELELVNSYSSLKEASYITGFNKDSIKTACNTKNGYKGFFWIREGDELPQKRKLKQCPLRKVGQYKNGKLIKEYNTIKQAGEETKTDPSSISKVCKGKRKTCNGYEWRYIE